MTEIFIAPKDAAHKDMWDAFSKAGVDVNVRKQNAYEVYGEIPSSQLNRFVEVCVSLDISCQRFDRTDWSGAPEWIGSANNWGRSNA